ncbi:hypothetical protein [Aliarcobacter butzleri]|uniref:hypothetical protein n=1 Tax=Aliarcobacter butzleri TaxID=28197 RepID=UPI002738D934|nr:hypothetical protein [Aliarcobacter butzleri]
MLNKVDKRKKYYTEKDFINHCQECKLDIKPIDLKAFINQNTFITYYSVKENNDINLEYNIYKNPNEHQKVIENGHPFDIAFQEFNPNIKKKSSQNTIHYYTRWQIFIISEILNHQFFIEKKICSIKHYHLIKKIKNPFSSSLNEFEDYFQTITNFMMVETLLFDQVFKQVKETNGTNIIEGEYLSILNEKIKEISIKHFEKHEFSSWIKFLRKLTELYNNYLKVEKMKLSEEIKVFLSATINMIINTEEKIFENICEAFDCTSSRTLQMKDNIFFYSGDLKRIFPDDIELSIEQFKLTFKNLTNEIKIDELITYLKSEKFEFIFLHIFDIEKIWFNREHYWQRKLWAYIRSLTIGIEAIAKQKFSCKLSNLHSHLGFIQTNGDNSISTHLTKTRIGDSDSIEDYLEKLNILIEASKREQDAYKEEYFYHIFYLTRNFFAHKFKVDDVMTGIIFYPIYESLKKTLLKVYETQGQN